VAMGGRHCDARIPFEGEQPPGFAQYAKLDSMRWEEARREGRAVTANVSH
jgi:hypothetical protein